MKQNAEEKPSPPGWLTDWSGDPDDVKLKTEQIINEIYAFERRWFKKAMPVNIAGLLDKLFALFGTPKNVDEIIEHYQIVLKDIPDDLFGLALHRCIKKCKFMPKPAEIQTMVQKEINIRRAIFNNMRAYRMYSDRKKWD